MQSHRDKGVSEDSSGAPFSLVFRNCKQDNGSGPDRIGTAPDRIGTRAGDKEENDHEKRECTGAVRFPGV